MVDGRNSWIYFIPKRLSGSAWRILQTLNSAVSNCLGTPPPLILTLDVLGTPPITFYTDPPCPVAILPYPRPQKCYTFYEK